jgi:outer membrane receptor protein involved in Fe transport
MTWQALVCAAALLMTAPAMAMADSARFNIAAQPLPTALKAFAEQARMQLLYQPGAVDRAVATPVAGDLDKHAALEQLLHGTGLEAVYSTDNAATIRPIRAVPTAAASSSAAGASSVLDRDAPATTGSPPKSTFWDRFRLAQVDQGASSGSTPVEKQNQQASKEKPVLLEEIVVTAQKREERLQNVPISISVLGGTDLDKSTFDGVSDALSIIPGVTVSKTGQGDGSTLTVRGVGAPPLFFGSSPVAYYLDSVPFGLVKSAIEPDENAYDLKQVEVLRGPQGTLYGASALNGVVRVLTNDADVNAFDLKARVSDSGTEYGGNNYRADTAINVPIIPGKLAVRAIVGYENDSGWIDAPNKNNINDAELRNYRLKVNAQPIEDLSIGLSTWNSRDNYGAPSIGYTFDKTSALLNQPIVTDFDAYGLKVGYQFSGYTISSATSYLNYKNTGYWDITQFLGGLSAYAVTDNFSKVVSEELLLNSPNQGDWRWSVGGMYRHATGNLYQYLQTTEIPQFYLLGPTVNDSTSKSYAAYGEVTRLLFGGQFELTAGLRHFQDNLSQNDRVTPATPYSLANTTANANTPRVVLTWHPNDRQIVYASYSEGFRSGFAQVGLPVNAPQLLPDKLRNFEVGSKGSTADGVLSYDTSVYFIDWIHVQQGTTVLLPNLDPTLPPIPVSYEVNGQSASGLGADFGVTAKPVKNLTLRINASWNNLKWDSDVLNTGAVLFHKGDRLDYSPEYTIGAATDYVVLFGGTGFRGIFSAQVNRTSSMTQRALAGELSLPNTGDSMTIARTSFSIDSPDHWRTTVFVDNVANERGAPLDALGNGGDYKERVRPRTAGVQLDYKY